MKEGTQTREGEGAGRCVTNSAACAMGRRTMLLSSAIFGSGSGPPLPGRPF